MDNFIGREKEKARLQEAYHSRESEFVVIYGRRRVGKTWLVREVFDNNFTFYHAGLSKVKTRGQLKEFAKSLHLYGENKTIPKDWSEAFTRLSHLIEQSQQPRKVIFIDEMPWLDTARSDFMPALEHFWNSWVSARQDVLLIACGSATSWIIKKLFKNKGGLHNRITDRMRIHPFSLYECELYANHNGLEMLRQEIAETYMVFGGIPYYWKLISPKLSLPQNIDELIFNEDGQLAHEYEELYASLYAHPEKHIKIIEALGKKKCGLTRTEIVEHTKLPDNGSLSDILEELIQCGFIRKYCHFTRNVKDALYQLIDNFTLFYFNFRAGQPMPNGPFWMSQIDTHVHSTWKGLAFENLCLLHIRQIKQALGIAGIVSNEYSWFARKEDGKKGAQIDLLIDRSDNRINICEMKCVEEPYEITEKDQESLINKKNRFKEAVGIEKAVHIVLVTTKGIKRNKYSDVIHNSITLDHLFLPLIQSLPT